jgi:DNA repair protein RadC
MTPLPPPIALPGRRASGRSAGRGLVQGPGLSELADAELVGLLTGAGPLNGLSLLEAVGGVRGLRSLDALPAAERCGLRPAQVRRLASAVELGRRVAEARADPGWRIRSPADVGDRMLPSMRHLEREELRTLLLNTKNVVTASRTVYLGNLAGSAVRVGEVFCEAVRRQAAAIVVVHNHPSGDPTPSADDLRITAELAAAGRLLDIELLDHVVIGSDSWVSLRAMGAT